MTEMGVRPLEDEDVLNNLEVLPDHLGIQGQSHFVQGVLGATFTSGLEVVNNVPDDAFYVEDREGGLDILVVEALDEVAVEEEELVGEVDGRFQGPNDGSEVLLFDVLDLEGYVDLFEEVDCSLVH